MTPKEKILSSFDRKFRNGATSTARNDEIADFLSSALDEMYKKGYEDGYNKGVTYER